MPKNREKNAADKEIEVFGWLTKQGYDRKASKDIAPIIVKYLDSIYAAPNVPTESEIEEAINDFVPPRYIDSPYWFNARHTARKMAEWIINCYITKGK